MREKICFNNGWRFHEGELTQRYPSAKAPIYNSAKAEVAQWGPANRYYADATKWVPQGQMVNTEYWQDVNLPHDYVIDQVPDKHNNDTLAFVKTENSWYRKHFKLSEEDHGKRISLYFEGVTNCCTVWVNSCLVKRNFCGYVPFEIDITDYLYYGEADNVVALYIDASVHEGWWYDGGGIYRNVWMIKTDMVAVDTYGVYVAPKKVSDTVWEVPTETTVRNDDRVNHRITLKTEFLDEDGNIIASASQGLNVPLKYKATAKQTLTVENPKLWSCEEPNLHYCRTTVYRGSTAVDEYTVHFGFRTLEFNPEKGFFLNGKHTKIKGVCCHEDYGLEGKAVIDRVKRYRIKLLKEMGCNGYRTSHYSQSDQTLDELDKQGFLVMDETRWFGTCDEYIDQLETLVKKDRNRPGVIMWSLYNEEKTILTELGKRFIERNAAVVRRLDTTRPITSACSTSPDRANGFDVQDIIGINYNNKEYEGIHEKYPNKMMFSSENCATGSSRGWYYDNSRNNVMINANDHSTNAWFTGREGNWKFFMSHDWIAGGYQWAGIEHRGEAEGAWPRLCSQSGALDLFLQKKDAFYQNKSHWTTEPMVHILPHWNLDGRQGEDIPVWAYTNCEELELFYNGVSMGRKQIEKFGHGEWTLCYEPGTVEVKGYIGGKEVASDRKTTTGRPVALKLEMQTEALFADTFDGAVIHCYAVDENGLMVPDATPTVSFITNSLGYIEATGSDITDIGHVSDTVRKMRAGAIALLVRSTGKEGLLRVYANSEGLKAARLDIEVVPKNDVDIR